MNILKPAAVLWDMDGTIVDTEPAWLQAEREMLREWGSEVSPADELQWVGIGLWDLAAVFQARGVRLDPDEIVSRLAHRVDELVFAGEPAWRPGARQLLESIADAGIPNVLVTMSVRHQAERIVELLPPNLFAGIVAGDEVDQPKPHPEPYERGAALVAVAATQCLAIEDSVTGARSAHAAGAVVIGVPNLIDLTQAPCHVILDTLQGVDAARIMRVFAEEKELL